MGRSCLAQAQRRTRIRNRAHELPRVECILQAAGKGVCEVRQAVRILSVIPAAGILTGALLATPFTASPASGQTGPGAKSYVAPRTANGKPDLNGIWQALSSAQWDLEDHPPQVGIPAGFGVIEGGVIPYQPSAAAQKKESFAKRAT